MYQLWDRRRRDDARISGWYLLLFSRSYKCPLPRLPPAMYVSIQSPIRLRTMQPILILSFAVAMAVAVPSSFPGLDDAFEAKYSRAVYKMDGARVILEEVLRDGEVGTVN